LRFILLVYCYVADAVCTTFYAPPAPHLRSGLRFFFFCVRGFGTLIAHAACLPHALHLRSHFVFTTAVTPHTVCVSPFVATAAAFWFQLGSFAFWLCVFTPLPFHVCTLFACRSYAFRFGILFAFTRFTFSWFGLFRFTARLHVRFAHAAPGSVTRFRYTTARLPRLRFPGYVWCRTRGLFWYAFGLVHVLRLRFVWLRLFFFCGYVRRGCVAAHIYLHFYTRFTHVPFAFCTAVCVTLHTVRSSFHGLRYTLHTRLLVPVCVSYTVRLPPRPFCYRSFTVAPLRTPFAYRYRRLRVCTHAHLRYGCATP